MSSNKIKSKFQGFNIDILSIDVGVKTQDILLYNNSSSINFKLVLPSASLRLYQTVQKYTKEKKHLILTGEIMGGGPLKAALYNHIKNGFKVFMTTRSAKTVKDNLDKVKNSGIYIVTEEEARKYINDKSFAHITTSDIDVDLLKYFLEKNGFIFEPKSIAVAVQDHGYSGPDEKDNITRFKLFRDFIPGVVSDFGFASPPDIYSRMCGIKRLLKKHFPDAQHLIMDSKIAGIFGALYGTKLHDALIIEIGNAHTTAAIIKNEKIIALFEHHTGMLTTASSKLKYYIDKFTAGKLTNQEIIDDGGHGCYIPDSGEFNINNNLLILATGPNRSLIEESGLCFKYAMPYNDIMIAGNIGLIECCKRMH